MDNAQKFETFAKEKLRTILKDSGHVLYSSAETLCQGEIYLLGHNPGGSPEGREDESIENSLNNLAAKKTNEYLDDSWNGLAPGDAVLQRRVCWLLEQLNMDVREVCASNLIFSRSVNAKSSNFKDMANLCWPVHEYILDIVKPATILTFGNSDSESPFSFLKEKLGIHSVATNYVESLSHGSGHGSGNDEWKCKAFHTSSGGYLVIGLPHLSRYAVNHHEDVSDWIKNLHEGWMQAIENVSNAEVAEKNDKHKKIITNFMYDHALYNKDYPDRWAQLLDDYEEDEDLVDFEACAEEIDYLDHLDDIQDKMLVQETLSSAENGNAKAQYNLGLMCLNESRDVFRVLSETDSCIQYDWPYQEAVRWFKKAAEQGHGGAQHKLSLCYREGLGVKQDLEKADYWDTAATKNEILKNLIEEEKDE